MTQSLGDFPVDAAVTFLFTTHAATGAAVAPLSAFEIADVRIYKNSSATQRTSSSGMTMTSPFDSVTGLHCVEIDLTDNTDAGFFAVGNQYHVVLVPDTETVDGQTVVSVLATFGITVNSATILADAVNTKLGTPPNLGSGATFGDNSTDIWNTADSVDGTLGASGSGLTAIPWNAAWDAEVQSEAADAITAAALATAADLATLAGYVDTEVAAILAAVDTEVAAILADTNELQTDWANGGRLDLILDARASQTSVDDLPTNAELATALGTADDATLAAIAALNNLSSAQAQTAAAAALTAYDPPTNAEMEARTLAAASYATASALDAVDNFVDTEVAAIKAVTDKIDTALELDGAVYRYTANALEQAPAGGGGTADWTSGEREQIRYRLQLDGTQTAPADTDLPAVNVTLWAGDGVNDAIDGYVPANVYRHANVAVAAADGDGNVPVVLYGTQPAVTFGQVKIVANVSGEGALHIVNSHASGHGQLNSGGLIGVRNQGVVGQFNSGSDGPGQWNDGTVAGQQNQGASVGQVNSGLTPVSGVDEAGTRAALGMAAADLDSQLDAIGGLTAQEVANAALLTPVGVAAAGSAMDYLADIVEDTGTTLPGLIAAGGGLDLDTVLETPMTFGEALRVMLAALAGKTAGSGTPALTFYGQDGATERIAATVDGLGNRTAVTVDGAE